MDEQNKNLILATALSFLVIMVWTIFFSPVQEPLPEQTGESLAENVVPEGSDLAAAPPVEGATTSSGVNLAPETGQSRSDALSTSERIQIETPRLTGSLPVAQTPIMRSTAGLTLMAGSKKFRAHARSGQLRPAPH